ncbi:hypothetical protein GCM10011492_40200 [Flexivirga endophytica]|uniref:GlsB/YeaQ/YmgE family stress response membrane protein n=1 Tax=Flexivirga endophytica TaxID=1849103 RepID=A0A916TGY5_9MICO|nr:GlsB/YeaQ/YmgE family stress response membrane protein [Flexivirga endophytica]GGB45060.1 hypothetical protein GCM10011492_40200 [Flexivirga endophytica]GHB68922.1 hypothetical protein GCM10008112_42090 [Flexivirga endophytica]
MIGAIIGSIIAGLIIGAVARLILPGKQDLSILMTIAIGVVSSLIVGLVLGAVLGDHPWISWIVSVIVACGAIVLYGKVSGKEQLAR